MIGIAVYNPDDGTIMLHCCQGRDWECTKDFTGLTAHVYNSTLKTEDAFKAVLVELAERPIATFAEGVCKDCFRLYGLNTELIIGLPSALSMVRSSFVPWEGFEVNPAIHEWIKLLNRQRVKISRRDLAESVKAVKSDHRIYGITCLDNLELDGAIWDAIINSKC